VFGANDSSHEQTIPQGSRPDFRGTGGVNEQLRSLAEEYDRVARSVLGDNLTSVVLSGAVAWGEAGSRSDIDLFVVCRELPKGAFRWGRREWPFRRRTGAKAPTAAGHGGETAAAATRGILYWDLKPDFHLGEVIEL